MWAELCTRLRPLLQFQALYERVRGAALTRSMDGPNRVGRTQTVASTRIGTYPISIPMSHTIREKTKLLGRVRRIKGQVEAIERALDEEAGCDRVMHMIAGVRGALTGLMTEVIEDHVREHLVVPGQDPATSNAEAAEELIDVIRTYLK